MLFGRFFIIYFVFCRKKAQVWNKTTVNKWWQNLYFCVSLVSSVPGFSELLYTAIQMYLCVEYVCIQCVVNPTVNAQQVCFLTAFAL